MKQVEERYISLLTDFGFKRIFGSAPNKDLLICFLNSLFNGRQVVKDVKYLNPENVGDIYTDRKAIFDVYCEGENGEKFIVEMQNLYKLTQRPKALCDKVFDRLFEEAEIARFTPQEQREYEASKMAYRDIKNSIDTAKREGIAEGMILRSLEIARKMLANGMDAATVMEITGLSAEEILLLKREK